MSIARTTDVTKFLKYLVDMTMVFGVDDDNYVIAKDTGDRHTIAVSDKKLEIILYQEKISDRDAQVFNPLAEGLGDQPSGKWFFEVQKTALLGRMFVLILAVIKAALDEKKTKKDASSESHTPMALLNVAAQIVDDVDDKLYEEFTSLASDKAGNELLTIYYKRKDIQSVLRCALFDSEEAPPVIVAGAPLAPTTWKSKFKLRKKSWVTLEKIMLAVLNIKDKDGMDRFTRPASELACPRLSSFLDVLIAVYQEINPLLGLINPDIAIDLSVLVHHVNNLSSYANNAKSMLQPTRSAPTPPAVALPTMPGQFPQQQMMPGAPGAPTIPGAVILPGPQFIDGRQGAPVAVAPQVQPGYMTGYGQMPGQMMPVHPGIGQGGGMGMGGGMYGYGAPQPMGYQPPPFIPGPNDVPFDGPYVGQGAYPQQGYYPPPGGVPLNIYG